MFEHSNEKHNACTPAKSSKKVFNLESPRIKSEPEVSADRKREGKEGSVSGRGGAALGYLDQIMGQALSLCRMC